MNGLAPEYVAARRVLLDAFVALEGHLDNLVLVGAQAVYHHTGSADLNVPLMTTDADPTALGPDPPPLPVMMTANACEPAGQVVPSARHKADGNRDDQRVLADRLVIEHRVRLDRS